MATIIYLLNALLMIHNRLRDSSFDILNLSHLNLYNKIFIYHQKFPQIKNYCLIAYHERDTLHISFYAKDQINQDYPIVFTAKSAEVLSKLIGLHNNVSNHLSSSHALYIGIELMKAELSMITGQKYIQN